MTSLDYLVIIVYFIGLLAVSFIAGRRIKSSEDMFIAGRNSSWWLSGISSYMTLFSAGTFVIWGGVAYKSGLVAVIVAMCLGIASLMVGKWIAGRWRKMKIKSPGEYLRVRFSDSSVKFYTIAGMIGKAVTSAVALYSIAVMLCSLVELSDGNFFASTGMAGDSAAGHLSIWWAMLGLGLITVIYTMAGGFLAVLMTDVVQFGVILAMIVFMIPLSLNAVGGFGNFIDKLSDIPGYFSGTSPTYSLLWLVLWTFLNAAMIGGDWPFIQRYISVPTVKDAKKSTYLIGILYLVTPVIWYLPAMAWRVLNPGPGMDVDPAAMTVLGEGAYIGISRKVLMTGMVGMMLAAMLSATLSIISGAINVFANVFTYEIWGSRVKNRQADEKKRMRVGRVFTLFFGAAIIIVAMLIPFAGGAEKVIVTILTMFICPLYIPSIWGVFSKRLTSGNLFTAMAVTWVVGFTAKFTVPASVISGSLLESICGLVIPLTVLAIMELCAAKKGKVCQGFESISAMVDEEADKLPGTQTKKAVKSFSHMALDCFCLTIAAIALLLFVLLLAKEPRTMQVSGIVTGFVTAIAVFCAAYLAYRIIDGKKSTDNQTK